MASRTIEVSCKALTKIQLHAAKYPHCGVNGVLLACKHSFTESKILNFVDAVPLFHQALQLTPMLEIALMNIDSYCSSHGLYIAGYYQAPKYLKKNNDSPGIFTCRIADKVKENFGESVLVIIDNLEVPNNKSLKFYERASDAKWKPRQSSVSFEDGSEDALQDFLDRNVHKDLVDFDNHLDDISLHWLNHDINQLIVMK
uniref:ER membrane protein complex subunit 8/9 homolog n=1 Tax=Styela clava TaxID=7725 RepID=UPI001939B0CD|nr:ER membrane protein complex subunit 8/9 homolog [Styela clava]